jgi:hypothetical protein
MNLLFGAAGSLPVETGLQIAANGQITFAPGQTFPGGGSGTISSVGLSAPTPPRPTTFPLQAAPVCRAVAPA